MDTLKKAYPKLSPPQINISDRLVLTEDDGGKYDTLGNLAQHILETSLSIIKTEGYQGVFIAVSGKDQLIVFDSTLKTDPKKIAFSDMIGQPTWIGVLRVQVNLMLRHDLQIGDYIQFPPGVPTIGTAQEVTQQASDRTAFQGVFQVIQMRHVGHFRQATAASWITTITATGELPPGVSNAQSSSGATPQNPSQ
jgi:hypothetical protein